VSDRWTGHLVILIYINTIFERVSRKCSCLNNQPLDENKALTFSQSTDTFRTNTTTAGVVRSAIFKGVAQRGGNLRRVAQLSGGLHFYRNPNKEGTKKLSTETRKSGSIMDAGQDDSDNNNNITIIVLLSNNIPPQQKHVVISYCNNIELIYFRLLRLLGPHTWRFKYLLRRYSECAFGRTSVVNRWATPHRHRHSSYYNRNRSDGLVSERFSWVGFRIISHFG